jgi:hypothetical protein
MRYAVTGADTPPVKVPLAGLWYATSTRLAVASAVIMFCAAESIADWQAAATWPVVAYPLPASGTMKLDARMRRRLRTVAVSQSMRRPFPAG